jgi:hypothetical protein
VVLPLCLFVVLVGGIAWVSQYLPSWKTQKALPPGPKEAPLKFTAVTTAEMDPKRAYFREFEKDAEGHLDFLFVNPREEAVELGVDWKKCGCSRLETCLLKPEYVRPLLELERQGKLAEARAKLEALTDGLAGWQPMAVAEEKGVEVPPARAGVLRLIWRARKEEEAKFEVNVQLWMRPAGVAFRDRFQQWLSPAVALVPAVRLHPTRLDVGRLLARSAVSKSFLYWSATRDSLEAKYVGEPDPCLVCQVIPVKGQDLARAQQILDQIGYRTRIRSACRVRVTLYEEKDGKQLDMGAFVRPVPIKVKAGGEVVDVPSPVLVGGVRSDVQVVGGDEQGQINLGSFRAGDGTTQTVRLLVRPQVRLTLASGQPPTLQVKLAKKETAADEATWELEVTVPPSAFQGRGGHLPEDTAVVLQAASPGRPPRRVRIHVTGIAARD